MREALQALGLKSQGDPLSFDVQGNELIGFVNNGVQPIGTVFNDGVDRPVFKLTIEENGDYTFELFDQMDHDLPFDQGGSGLADENFDLIDGISGDVFFLNFGKVVKATDFDGDSVILDGKFKVKIRDDVPELTGEKIVEVVDEDDIDTIGDGIPGGSHGTSVDDGDGDGSFSGNPNIENGDNPSFAEGPAQRFRLAREPGRLGRGRAADVLVHLRGRRARGVPGPRPEVPRRSAEL